MYSSRSQNITQIVDYYYSYGSKVPTNKIEYILKLLEKIQNSLMFTFIDTIMIKLCFNFFNFPANTNAGLEVLIPKLVLA